MLADQPREFQIRHLRRAWALASKRDLPRHFVHTRQIALLHQKPPSDLVHVQFRRISRSQRPHLQAAARFSSAPSTVASASSAKSGATITSSSLSIDVIATATPRSTCSIQRHDPPKRRQRIPFKRPAKRVGWILRDRTAARRRMLHDARRRLGKFLHRRQRRIRIQKIDIRKLLAMKLRRPRDRCFAAFAIFNIQRRFLMRIFAISQHLLARQIED